jgi:hypothetical protein
VRVSLFVALHGFIVPVCVSFRLRDGYRRVTSGGVFV